MKQDRTLLVFALFISVCADVFALVFWNVIPIWAAVTLTVSAASVATFSILGLLGKLDE